MIQIPFNNRYVTLGDTFYVKTSPSPVANPKLIKFNDELAEALGLSADNVKPDELAAVFSGNSLPDGAEPLAMAYAGHQFGHFSPQLGDGRAILLGEIRAANGVCFDMQLKGCGRTFYSRGGDGRAALGPVLREYLVSEAMAKLGVPTTRALAAVTTGEQIARERLIPGGIITRIASSFVRVGTFQYFASQENNEAVKKLADYVITHNYPEVADAENPYLEFFSAVLQRQARLIAQWMQLGFIHGVMNTDNMSIAGETIDYGPCAFMDAYDQNQVFSSIDQGGRYAYGTQPNMGLWNLIRLAESLLPLLADTEEEAIEVTQTHLKSYSQHYQQAWLTGMSAKCGLTLGAGPAQDDRKLIEALLELMAANNADFTLTFYYLSQLSAEPTSNDNELRSLFDNPEQIDDWLINWRQRLGKENLSDQARQKNMQAVNPVYIPRNHQIEAAIRMAEDHNNFTAFHELYEVLQNPYVYQKGKEDYMLPPEPEQVVEHTFCGT